jgi:hypothetical protein
MKAEEAEKEKARDAADRGESSVKPSIWELNTSAAPSLKVENSNRVSLASNGEK